MKQIIVFDLMRKWKPCRADAAIACRSKVIRNYQSHSSLAFWRESPLFQMTLRYNLIIMALFSKRSICIFTFSLLLKSVDFHEKGLCFASRMCSIGKHPRPPACGGLRGKNRGFRTLNDAVLRASLMPAENMIDEMSDACYNMDNQTTL